MKIENYHGDIRDVLIALDYELKDVGYTAEDWLIIDSETAILVVKIEEADG